MASTILINTFEVPADREDEFLLGWQRVADHSATQPGCLGTRLHRALAPDSRFRFINVGEYESARHFRELVGGAEFRRLAAALSDFPSTPALYTVVREHHV